MGMAGFVVLAVSEHDGELEQAIESTADLVGCPTCAAVAELHDRRPVWVRDLPSGGRRDRRAIELVDAAGQFTGPPWVRQTRWLTLAAAPLLEP